MNRRLGMESQLGVGGGIVSKESQKNLDKAEDLCRRRKPEQAVPYLLKAMEDENNLDAFIQAAFLFPLNEAVQFLEDAERKGRQGLKRRFGPLCFNDDAPQVGRFWDILETRPYMRVLQAQVRLYFENRQFAKSANTIIEMLRLCPGDNTAQRTWLGSMLLHAGRASDALSFAQNWLLPREERADIVPRGGAVFKAPCSDPLSAEQVEKLSKRSPGSIAYSAALAAYKLWGNSALACQYLRIATSCNPTVLTKILIKADKPRNLNNMPRGMNGPEEAQDYLWLTQDLWMESSVWNWANGDQPTKAILFKTCSRKGCNVIEGSVALFKRCAACKEVVYCSQTCQKEDWRDHKPRCQFNQRRKETVRAMQNGRSLPEDAIDFASADFSGGMVFTQTT
ncbi:hypothetical protein BJ138DRAFT_1171344 [Hygrophoropsis aurantiaca]|uniref:Uncharacterized protein n=1 Tax=Hygrophoropsis aurantiaca TaxID=72124 RepID=A0ACB8ALA0_9AGAM|nr:hypothetical protein BJ138DRAFT_1171344 [Hygrophoropsis aurantiaca]